ncbi:hypothetical protein K438DRAFT_1516578, partial [Mycena galopus ATCC 62051]
GGGGGRDGANPLPVSNPWVPPDWQLNCKLNLNMVPAWDGHGKTVIDYLCLVVELTRLSPQMIVDLSAMVPLKFTDRAQTWWQTMPIDFRNCVSQNWNLLFNAISVHFLNEICVHKRTMEWEEMRFRQKGRESEWPLDFIQRRIKHHMFLFTASMDGPEVMARILRNAPDVWLGTINSTTHRHIFSLKAAVVVFGLTLMSNWNQALRLETLDDYPQRQHCCQGHAATIEEIEDEDELLPKSGPPSKTAHAADSQARNRHVNRPTTPRPDWPEGRTVKGHVFVKHDHIHSPRKPPGNCYICMSGNHFVRNCQHYGTWLSLRDANMIDSDVDAIREAEDLREWLAMTVEANNDSISAY